MRFLAISGSARADSTNTALLRAVAAIGRPKHAIGVFSGLADLPVFSPDLEAGPLPGAVRDFAGMIGGCDGVIISSPEYVRAIPGGLKNAIDWLVSRDELIDKPIAMLHASHRGDDMLGQLRQVLATVSQGYSEDPFLRFDLMKMSPGQILRHFETPEHRLAVTDFLDRLAARCGPGTRAGG